MGYEKRFQASEPWQRDELITELAQRYGLDAGIAGRLLEDAERSSRDDEYRRSPLDWFAQLVVSTRGGARTPGKRTRAEAVFGAPERWHDADPSIAPGRRTRAETQQRELARRAALGREMPALRAHPEAANRARRIELDETGVGQVLFPPAEREAREQGAGAGAAFRDFGAWLAGRSPAEASAALERLLAGRSGDAEYRLALMRALHRAGTLGDVLARGVPAEVWRAAIEARRNGVLSALPRVSASRTDRATAMDPEPSPREAHLRRVEAGIAWIERTARSVGATPPGEIARAVVRRVPVVGRTVDRAVRGADAISGGAATRALTASWRWLDRFAAGARAMASTDPALGDSPSRRFNADDAGLSPAGGAPLSPELAARMAAVLGHDFSHVRIHVGGGAATGARALGARAVTVGSHIFFADGQYAPDTDAGERLLIHELTHVIQHDRGRLPTDGEMMRLSDPSEDAEIEARAAEERLAPRAQAARATAPAPAAAPAPGREPSMGGQASRGVGDWLQQGAAFVVRQVSPGLATLIERGPMSMLREAIQPAVGGWISSVTGGVDIAGTAGQLVGSFQSAFAVLQGARNGDARCCETLTRGINAIRDLGDAFANNPAIQGIRSAFGTISEVVSRVLRVVLAPAFDVVKDIVGGVWDVVSGMARTVMGWLRAVRDVASDAAEWVAHQLGFPAATGEGGLTDWLKEKASEIWNGIKETLRPVAGPLMAIGGVVVALSPLGPLMAAILIVPRLVRAAQWLWAHRSDPDLIRSAHAEMGHTMLPQILEAGQSFAGAVRDGASWLVGKVVELGSGLLELLGGLSGVPLLDMARGFVQGLARDVQSIMAWGQGALGTAVEAVTDVFHQVADFIRPYQEVLCSIGLAIASPPMIPVILAGWAWRWLPDCIKPPIVDLLLDVVIGALEVVPFVPMFGVLWPVLKNFVVGFLRGFRNRKPTEKIELTNKLARILSGASPEFLVGFVIGVLKGVWDGIKQPFEAIWLLAEGLTTVVEYFQRLAGQDTWQPREAAAAPRAQPAAGSQPAPTSSPVAVPAVTPENVQSAIAGVASELTAQQQERRRAAAQATPAVAAEPAATPAAAQMAQVAGEARTMAGELSAPVGEVAQNFWPAVQELFQGGEGMTLDTFIERMGAVWDAARGALQSAGGQLAAMICDFFLQPSAERSLGEGVGYIVGMFAFQALLDYLSAGTWTGAMGVISQIARFLNWPNAALGEVMQLLSRLGRYVLDGVRRLGSMIRSAASGALSRVMAAFTRIGEMLGGFAERLMGRAGAIEEAAVAGSRADDVARLGAHADDVAAAGSRADDVARAEERAASRADDAAESAAAREARKAEELVEAEIVVRTLKTSAQVGRVPAQALALALDGLKARYTWINHFEMRPRGGRMYELHMIASDHNEGPYEDPLLGPSGKAWDDVSLTQDEFIRDYRARYPDTRLSDAELAEHYAAGRRLNPDTDALARPQQPLPAPEHVDLPTDPETIARWNGYQRGGSALPCFPAGTMVQTPDGPRAIDSLRGGDAVYAWDEEAGQVTVRDVVRLHRNWTQHIVSLHTTSGSIETTRGHRFWVAGAGWLPAARIEPGMMLRDRGGASVLVSAVEIVGAEEATYNLEVADDHTYFVAEGGVLVHNEGESAFASREAVDVTIYRVVDAENRVVYVGQSVQGIDQRLYQHINDVDSALYIERSPGSPLIQVTDDACHYRIQRVTSGRWTPYEAAVWEQHYMDHYRGVSGDLMLNRQAAITEEKFIRYRNYHNPC